MFLEKNWARGYSLVVLAAAQMRAYPSPNPCSAGPSESSWRKSHYKHGRNWNTLCLPSPPSPLDADAERGFWLSKARQGWRMLPSLTSTSRTISTENRYYPENTICLGAFHEPLLSRKKCRPGKGISTGSMKRKEGREENALHLTGSYSSTQESWSWGIQTE